MKYIQPLSCALVISVIIMLFPSCETVPVIVGVDKRQEGYEMPSEFWLHGIGDMTMDELAEKCEGNINGCIIPQGNDEYIMYFRNCEVADHEFDHVCYGPKHNKVKR